MTQKEAIEQLLTYKGTTKSDLAKKMGYSKPTAISNMLARGNMTVDTLYQICELFNYEITIQPKGKPGSKPAGQIKIEGKERAE